MNESVRKWAAELIGTFVLVFGGVGSAVLAGDEIGFLGVSFAFGLALLAMAYAIGPVSGCHINPAVTLAMFLTRKTPPRDAVAYVVAQIVGAILAAAVLLVVAEGLDGFSVGDSGFGANGYGDHSPEGYGALAAFVVEVVLTAFLVLTVLGATHPAAPIGFAGIPIGLVLTLIHLVSIPVTNTSVNPARSIGPAVFVGGWALGQLWLFILAPLLGSVLAVGLQEVVHLGDPVKADREVRRQTVHSGRADDDSTVVPRRRR
jgi:aquaporin Z